MPRSQKPKKSNATTRLLNLTRDLAKIEKGKKNPDSLVYEAHQKAMKAAEPKKKKPVY